MQPTRRRIVLSALALPALFAGTWGAWVAAQPAERVVRIVARKFEFTPGEVTLKKDVPTVLEFTAPDAVMGFSAPDFKVRADIIPGKVARVRLVPQKTGSFEYLCDIFCGDGHENMHGRIIVVD